jgi:hypothetical protein
MIPIKTDGKRQAAFEYQLKWSCKYPPELESAILERSQGQMRPRLHRRERTDEKTHHVSICSTSTLPDSRLKYSQLPSQELKSFCFL